MLIIIELHKRRGGGGKILTATEVIPLDGIEEYADAGGFTCTGLCFDATDSLFYVGNFGKRSGQDSDTIRPSIVVLAKTLDKKVAEIAVGEMFPAMEDIQGIAVNPDDGTIWFCSFAEKKVRHIDKEGNELGAIDIYTRPTGIAYDSKRDCLWVLTYKDINRVTLNGNVKATFPIQEEGQDQLYYDVKTDRLLMTAGLDYHKASNVYEIDPDNGAFSLLYRLDDSFAVEGIAVLDDSCMYVANDGLYHDAKVARNQINKYIIDGTYGNTGGAEKAD